MKTTKKTVITKKLEKLAEAIKEKALETLEEVDGNGNYNVSFYFEQGENIIEVKAVIEVSDYYYDSGDWENPPSQNYDTEFLNAHCKMIFNSNSVEMPNVTNELNKLLE